MRRAIALLRWVLVVGSLFGSAAALAAVCTSGQQPYSVTITGYTGNGDSIASTCANALTVTAAGDSAYAGGSWSITESVICTIRKPSGAGERSGTVSGPVCEVYSGSNAQIVDKLEEVRLAVLSSGGGSGGTVTAVISSEGVLNVNDAETRSMLIAAFCVAIVALGFIGGNLS